MERLLVEVSVWGHSARLLIFLPLIIAKHGCKAIGRVRVDAANHLRHDRPARPAVNQAHCALVAAA